MRGRGWISSILVMYTGRSWKGAVLEDLCRGGCIRGCRSLARGLGVRVRARNEKACCSEAGVGFRAVSQARYDDENSRTICTRWT